MGSDLSAIRGQALRRSVELKPGRHKYVEREITKWAATIKASGITPQ
jgi:hypothetical protein